MPSSQTETLHELHITRLIAAPPELVFAAFTDPAHLAAWWGPKGFTNPRCEADPRPGGRIRIDMRGPDGAVYPMDGRFVEIIPPQKLVLLTAPLDAEGNRVMETINTLLFTQVEGGTELTLHVRITRKTPPAEKHLAGMSQGWSETLDRLKAFVLQLKASLQPA